MQVSVWLMARAGSVVRVAGSILLGLTCLFGVDQASFAAVVLDGVMLDNGKGVAELAEPNAVDADSLGNVYVADHWTARIVKFNSHGKPVLVMGGYGSGPRKLDGPVGVAVGETGSFGTLIYVADTNNGRVSVFNDLGNYKATLDTADGVHLNGPHSVAFVGNGAGGGFLLVADSLNYRILLFLPNGQFSKAFNCPTCPGGHILPVGITGSIKNGVFRIYATDAFTQQIQVINGTTGKWIRTIGKPWVIGGTGPQKGHLQTIDEVSLDDDGNVWVADTGSAHGDAQRISEFDSSGNFILQFGTAGGVESKFQSPHGVGIGEQGEIYVTNTGRSDVYRFRLKPPALQTFLDDHDRAFWISSKGAWFSLSYNGVEQTCRARVNATITAPSGSSNSFTVSDGPITIDAAPTDLKADLTTQQVTSIKNAWTHGKKITVAATFSALCQDGKRLQKTQRFTK